MNDVAAWLMQIDRLEKVAVGRQELIHIIPSPEYIEVPKAPAYCKYIVTWNNEIIPIIDLSMLVKQASAFHGSNAVAVTVYIDEKTDEIHYGGIQLVDMPVLDRVTNDQGIEKDELSARWKPLAISAYKNGNNDIIPVLDTQRLFSAGIDRSFTN